jgi:hypothetical protein
MQVCVRIYKCVCMQVCVHASVCTHIQVCVHASVCKHIQVCISVYAYTSVFTSVCEDKTTAEECIPLDRFQNKVVRIGGVFNSWQHLCVCVYVACAYVCVAVCM